MPWLSILTALLSIVKNLFGWLHDKQLLDAGAEAQIAKETLAIFEMTETGKRLLAKIEAMPDEELNELLKELGED